MRRRKLVIAGALGVAALSGLFFLVLRSELAPVEDRGLVQVRGTGPEGATLAYTRRYSNQVGDILAKVPEVESTLIINGSPEVSRFHATGRLSDWDDRKRSQQQINAQINPQLRRIPGVQASASNSGSFGQRGSSRPVEFVIQTSGTYEQLQEYVDLMLERIRAYPGWRAWKPICSSTCPSSASRWTARRSPISASTSQWSDAHSRRCSAGGR